MTTAAEIVQSVRDSGVWTLTRQLAEEIQDLDLLDGALEERLDGAVPADIRREVARHVLVAEMGIDVDEPRPKSRELTDQGNAHRLVDRKGHNLRYVHPFRRWYVWDGIGWRLDADGQVLRFAMETAEAMYSEAMGSMDPKARRKLAVHAARSQSERSLNAMIHLAAALYPIPAHPEKLDADPMLLGVENGVVNLATGALRDARRADLITKVSGTHFDPSATAPLFHKFLGRVLPEQGVRDYLRRLVGLGLIGKIQEHILPVLYGIGANGKTTFLETLFALLGDYAQKAPGDLLMRRRYDGIPNDIARLQGARLVSCVETAEGRRLDEVRVKELTGGDRIAARFMRAEWFDFTPVALFIVASNHKPVVRGTDDGIWRRIHLVPFEVQIPIEEQDRKLGEKLRQELPGILTWAVGGCLDYQRDGLNPPDEVLAATRVYRAEMDLVEGFLDDACVVGPINSAFAKDLYEAFTSWWESNGEGKPPSQRAFGERLTEKGFVRDRTGGRRIRRGLRLGETECAP